MSLYVSKRITKPTKIQCIIFPQVRDCEYACVYVQQCITSPQVRDCEYACVYVQSARSRCPTSMARLFSCSLYPWIINRSRSPNWTSCFCTLGLAAPRGVIRTSCSLYPRISSPIAVSWTGCSLYPRISSPTAVSYGPVVRCTLGLATPRGMLRTSCSLYTLGLAAQCSSPSHNYYNNTSKRKQNLIASSGSFTTNYIKIEISVKKFNTTK